MYTCNSCGLQFLDPEGQRSHMKSDWHRYNLKRRVASLPPLTEEIFNQKVKNLAIEENERDEKSKTKERQTTKKEKHRKEKELLLEKKKKLLEIARQNMMRAMADETKDDHDAKEVTEQVSNINLSESEKVKEDTKSHEREGDALSTETFTADDEEGEALLEEKLKNKIEIPLNVCMFCDKNFPEFGVCIDHMYKKHGFYIPEKKYLVDVEGLVKYMSEKLGIGNICFCCNYQGRSLPAVRAHMIAKKHCRIPYETEEERLEISDFYDFSATYDDLDTAEVTNGGNDEDDWEDVEETEQDENSSIKEELTQMISYDDGVELHLPSGLKVGHRSLARYFRQNLRPERELTEGQGTIIAAESRHLATLEDRAALVEKKRVWKNEIHHKDRDDRRAAKFINNQPHYRDQLLQ